MRDWHMDSGKDLFRKNLLESIPERSCSFGYKETVFL